MLMSDEEVSLADRLEEQAEQLYDGVLAGAREARRMVIEWKEAVRNRDATDPFRRKAEEQVLLMEAVEGKLLDIVG